MSVFAHLMMLLVAATVVLEDDVDLLGHLGRSGSVQASQVVRLAAHANGTLAMATTPAVEGEAAPPPPLPAPSSDDAYHASTHVLLTLPREAVQTEASLRAGALSYFLDSPAFHAHLRAGKEARLRDGKPWIPGTLVFALFFLLQQHAADRPHGDPLWQAWVASHIAAHTGEHALFRWSDAELRELEEPRLVEGAIAFRSELSQQYTQLLRPLIELYPSFFPPERIEIDDFFLAVAVTTSQSVRIAGIEGASLAPLPPLRHHPARGNVRLEEVEQELRSVRTGTLRKRRVVHLVATSSADASRASHAAVHGAEARGSELLLLAPHRHNDALLNECGYLWDELAGASVPLRMSLPDETVSTHPNAGAHRQVLLRQLGLNATADFELRYGGLPPGLVDWARIRLARGDEILTIASADALRDLPLSEATAAAVGSNLVKALGSLRAQFDHEVEEDDAILGSRGRTLSARAVLAVRHRRLSKRVLDDGLARVGEVVAAAQRRQATGTTASNRRATGSGGSGGYSTRRERKQQDAVRADRERRREEVRQRRSARLAAHPSPQ